MVEIDTPEGGFCLMRCRWLASLLLVLLLAATACSQPVRKVQPQEAAPRTLKVVVPKGHTVTEGLVAGFRQAHSNVTLELFPLDTSSYDAQARSYAAGDVVLFNPTTPPAGLLDLSPFMVRDRIDEDAYGMALNVLRSNGTLTGLPIRVEGLMLLYNKEMTEAAGVTIPAGGWTWDEFRTVTARLVRQDLKGTVPAMGSGQHNLLLGLYIEQKTGRPAWETDEQTLTEALAYFHTLIYTDNWLKATYPQAPQAIYSIYETKFVPLRMLEGDAVAKNRALDRAVSRVFSGTASVEAAIADWRRDLGLQ
jgi:ABC-type glycerol-3-phosphate transport system substrate-binding protein